MRPIRAVLRFDRLWLPTIYFLATVLLFGFGGIYTHVPLRQVDVLICGGLAAFCALCGQSAFRFDTGAGMGGLLVAIGIIGTLINKLSGNASSNLSLVQEFSIFLMFYTIPLNVLEGKWVWLRSRTRFLAYGYVVVTIVATWFGVGANPMGIPTHERCFVVVPWLCVLLMERRIIEGLGFMGLLVAVFLLQPKTTLFLVVLTAVIGSLILMKPTKKRLLAAGVLSCFLALFGNLVYENISDLNWAIKTHFDASDNSGFREVLWIRALEDFLKSPIVGDGFTGEMGYLVEVNDAYREIPAHSDFLNVLARGGALGALLILGCMFQAVVGGILAGKTYLDMGMALESRITFGYTLGIVAACIVMAVNPVLQAQDRGFYVALFLGMSTLFRLKAKRLSAAKDLIGQAPQKGK